MTSNPPEKNGRKGFSAQPPSSLSDLTSLTTRIRIAEEKASNVNRKFELLEGNFVASNKKQNETLRAVDADILDIKRELNSIRQKMDLIIHELKLTAGKDELNTLKRYLDIWDLTRFVSRDELDKILEERAEGKQKEASSVRKDL